MEASLRKEHDRVSKANKRAFESECEALVRKEQNIASLAKKRASEFELEASLRKEHDRASNANKQTLSRSVKPWFEENKIKHPW